MKYFEGQSVFRYPWDQVAQAFWVRYPNPHSNHVLSEDVIVRDVRNKTLYTKRLLTKTNRMPEWGKRIVNARNVSIIEESIVDPAAKKITTYTRNIGLSRIMTIEERCEYTVSNENSRWTTVSKQAWINSNVFGFARAIQAFGFDRFKKNCAKATMGYQYILERMFPHPAAENIHSMSETTTLKEKAKMATKLATSHLTTAAACAESSAQ